MKVSLLVGNTSKIRQSIFLRQLCLVTSLLLAACSSVPETPPTITTAPLTSDGNQLLPDDQSPPAATSKAADTPVAEEQRIYFAQGEASLSDENRWKIKQAAQYLKENPKLKVKLIAFSDSLGSRSYTLAIMDNRLSTVTDALHENGIAKSRIRKILISQKAPKRACTTPACQGEGLRIELRYK